MDTASLQLNPESAARHIERIRSSLNGVLSWVRDHNYLGFEPADGNLSFLFPLTLGRVMPMRVLQQVVLRSPLNVRPWLGIRPHDSPIARGYFAAAYLLLCRGGTEGYVKEAKECLGWLVSGRSPTSHEFCWGDPYEYATRGGRRPKGAATLIWSSLIGLSFLDGYEVLGDPEYLIVAKSVGRWIAALPKEAHGLGYCLSYVAYRQSSIHNANAMGAAFMARLGSVTGSLDLLGIARSAMQYTCSCQAPDGSWAYGEEPKYNWVDSFHTGYNLAALRIYRSCSQDKSFDSNMNLGLQFYLSNFFLPNGCPKYYHNRLHPIDIQCAAQAIETLSAGDVEGRELSMALKIADWTITNLQAPDGHFCYRHLGWRKVRTPMLHWGQGTMAKALAALLNRLKGPLA